MACPAPLSRRALLQGSGALVVSFVFAPRPGIAFAQRAGTPASGKSVDAGKVGGFLAIDSQGRVTLYSGKVELGTGVLTALTQIVAEELDVPLDRVATIQGDTLLTPDQHPTDSSLSIQAGGMQIRKAAATAREALLDQAATRLGIASDQLVVQ